MSYASGFMYTARWGEELIARPCALAVLGCTTHTTNVPKPGTLRGVHGLYAVCDGCRARQLHAEADAESAARARREGEALIEGFAAGIAAVVREPGNRAERRAAGRRR